MTFTETLKTRAQNVAGLTNLIGSGAAARFYPLVLPQNPKLPAVTYQIISRNRVSVMGEDTGVVEARVQMAWFGGTYSDVEEVGTQIRAAFKRWTETGLPVLAAFMENELDLYEDETGRYRQQADFIFWYRE